MSRKVVKVKHKNKAHRTLCRKCLKKKQVEKSRALLARQQEKPVIDSVVHSATMRSTGSFVPSEVAVVQGTGFAPDDSVVLQALHGQQFRLEIVRRDVAGKFLYVKMPRGPDMDARGVSFPTTAIILLFRDDEAVASSGDLNLRRNP
jgi:hypothetical protein